MTHVSVDMRQRTHQIRVAERLGANSRRPRHPFPALMAGETPGRVPVQHTTLKLIPSRHEQPQRSCTTWTFALQLELEVVVVVGANPSKQLIQTKKEQADAPNVLMVLAMSTVKKHLPLLTATLVLQLEPGKKEAVWANIVVAAEPAIQHATHPTSTGTGNKKNFPVTGFTLSQTES